MLPEPKGAVIPTVIPAAPGTFVIEDTAEGVIRIPVVAWAPNADNPYKAPYPLTAEGMTRLIDRAILFADGTVHDVENGTVHESVEYWQAAQTVTAIKGSPPVSPAPKAPAVSTGIEWMTEPYKSNAFYRHEDGYIFQVEPGELPPVQQPPITKIKRDEFVVLKKTMEVRPLSAVRGEPEEDLI